MIDHPFSLFDNYADTIDVRLFTKEDSILSDAETALALGTSSFVSLNQIHGNNTEIVRSPSRREKVADGSLTDQPDLWLTIRVADCQSFVVYVPELELIGVLHAGWKGLVAGAIPAFFETMQREWKVDPSTILIGAGPSLCMECAEFTDPTKELPGIDPQFFIGRHAALQSIASDQMMKCGVQLKNKERHADCTKCHPDKYWTYRGGDGEAVIKGATNVLCIKLKMKN